MRASENGLTNVKEKVLDWLKAENKLYSQHFGVKSWIFFIIGISIVYVKIKPYT